MPEVIDMFMEGGGDASSTERKMRFGAARARKQAARLKGVAASTASVPCDRCPEYDVGDDEDARKPAFRVYGLVTSLPYQRARHCVEKMYASFTGQLELPIIEGLLDFEWDQYLFEEQRTHGGRLWAMNNGVAVWDGAFFIGDDKDLQHYIASDVIYSVPVNSMNYFLRMVDDYYEVLRTPDCVFVTMDFQVGELRVGSMMFKLYQKRVPNTCQNFINLCKGTGEPNRKGHVYSYRGSRVHRIVRDGWIQCGDVTRLIGGGGHSSFGTVIFPDEAKVIKHDKRGILSMCNKGPNTNQSQFFVTLGSSPWMDKRYVAFGEAVEGAKVLRLLESVRTLYETPMVPIVIMDCSVLEDTGAKFWPSPPITRVGQRPSQYVPPPPVPSEDALKSPTMPPAPPAISEMIAKQGPKLWALLSSRFRNGRLLTSREKADALEAARFAAETAVEAALSVALEPVEAAMAVANAMIAAAVATQEASPEAAAKDAVRAALQGVLVPDAAAEGAARAALARAMGPEAEALSTVEDMIALAVDRAHKAVILKRGGVESIHDLRDVESVLCEERFLEGLYSLTVPDPIIWRAFDHCRDHLDEKMARTLLKMLARRAAIRYPCEDLGEDGEPMWPPPGMPDALKGPLWGTWTGEGTVDTEGGRWPWTGEGTMELVQTSTGEPLGIPSIAGMAYEIAEELLAQLDRQEPVLQDHARWAAKVGEELSLRIGTAGKEHAKEVVAAEIAAEVLRFAQDQAGGEADMLNEVAYDMLPQYQQQQYMQPYPEQQQNPQQQQQYPQQQQQYPQQQQQYPQQQQEYPPPENADDGQLAAQEALEGAVEGAADPGGAQQILGALAEGVGASGQVLDTAVRPGGKHASGAHVVSYVLDTIEEDVNATVDEVVQASQIAKELVDHALAEVEEKELRRTESVTSRLFDVLLGTEFFPAEPIMLAYSALIAQEILKAIAREPPGKRPDVQKAAEMFSIEELKDITACERVKAREIMDGAFQIVREVQIAAADVAYKYGVRSALPPEYLGYPPGELAPLVPLSDEDLLGLEDEEEGETVTSPTQTSATATQQRDPRQIYQEKTDRASRRTGVYRKPKPGPPSEPGDDPSYHYPGLTDAHV